MIKNKIFILVLTSFVFFGCGDSSNSSNDDERVAPSSELENNLPSPLANYECNDANQTTPASSTRPMLVILVSYNDIQISSDTSVWESKIFGKEENQLNHYYLQTSNSNFEFSKATELNGIVSVGLNKNHPDVDIDSSLFDSKVHQDLKTALELLDDSVSYNTYDTDGNGHITPDELLVTFIIAGYEDAYEGRHVTQGIWAHQYCVSSLFTPTLDGVTIMGCANDGNYAIFGEKHDKFASDGPTHDASIGIIAHELGHSAFNLPDLYNTSDPSSGGIGAYGLMGYGTWGYKDSSEYAGSSPTHMSAWSKAYNGWVIPSTCKGSIPMNASALDSFNTVKIPISSTEYYLLENRDNSGHDMGLNVLGGTFDGGLAIWHINEDKLTPNKISENIVNTDNDNKGVDLIDAAYANIDNGGIGHEKNLFYNTNINSFFNVSDIGPRGSVMTINID